MDEIELIGEKIRELRTKRGLTQKKLAEKIDSSERYLRTMELNGTDNVFWLKKIADALDAKIENLLPDQWFPHQDRRVILEQLDYSTNQIKSIDDLRRLVQLAQELASKSNKLP
ncbi:helix-turn-helix domain-containing protein [Ammoniphilus sp. 3BR4]|uniref:helix-turn-helix domain-containing protein n=1 Tax=Ammoniphilus sp. 3BR4 TaxID=3158265 RepID=UPI003466B355